MYYNSNQPPQNQAGSGNQWNRQGARPADFQSGGFQPPMNPRGRKKRGFGWQMFKLLVVLVLVGAVGAGIYVGKTYLDVKPYVSVFLDGVQVDGINLGGKTWEEGNAAVRNQISEKIDSWYVRISSGTQYNDITAKTLNINRDPSDALEAAWAIGHDTSSVNRKTIFTLQQEILDARTNGYSFSSVESDADLSKIGEIVAQIARAAYIAPQDAKMLYFDPESVLEPFVFQPEVVGRMLDADGLQQQILAMVNNFKSGEIRLVFQEIIPEVTVDSLGEQYALRGRWVTPVDSSSSDARNANIKQAFSKINGYKLTNGAKFSFNTIVGRRTLENGFYRAYEYNYGDLVMGIGGGVCQASTTVYLAAMITGMDLIDHTPHSEKVSYTELGLDATVVDTIGAAKDMSFRNTSGGTLYIAAHILQDPNNRKRYQCEVRIYGNSLGDTSYKLSTEQVKVLQPPSEPEYFNDEDGDYVTYAGERKTVRKASVGYVIDTYRETYVNGTQTARTKLTRSTYPARSERIALGVTPR